jgi:ribosomal protein S18 acetylase RimI-like enzyme
MEIDKEKKIEIIKELPEWFTAEAILNIEKDLSDKEILVDSEEKVKGFIIYSLEDKCSIYWMAVKKGMQNKGIGKKLIEELKIICKEKGIDFIETDTLAETEDYAPYEITRNFYHKVGFRDVKIIPEGYPEGNNKLILRLRI